MQEQPTRLAAEATLGLMTCWARGPQPVHTYALGFLPNKLNADKWQVQVQTRLAPSLIVGTTGTFHVTGFTQSWWIAAGGEEREGGERKGCLTVMPPGVHRKPTSATVWELGIWQGLRELRVIWLQVLNQHSFPCYYLRTLPGESEQEPSQAADEWLH